MLLSKLISGLGALSLARLGLAAAEEPLARRTDETEIADSSGQDEYNANFWCWKTKTVTCTETVTQS